MLWTIFVVLLILWLLGFVGFHVLGGYIHILLLIALIVLVFNCCLVDERSEANTQLSPPGPNPATAPMESRR